jgi:hypothetical protein
MGHPDLQSQSLTIEIPSTHVTAICRRQARIYAERWSYPSLPRFIGIERRITGYYYFIYGRTFQ